MIWIERVIRGRRGGVAVAFAVMVGSVAGIGNAAQPALAQTSTAASSQQTLENALDTNADVIQLTDSFSLDGTPITIDRDVVIEGDGLLASDRTVSVVKANGSSAGQAFIVTGGSVTFKNFAITGADTRNKGGALQIGAGAAVTLESVYLQGNRADEGGAIYNGGTLTIEDSTIEANSSSRKGGGVESDGSLTVVNSTFTSNVGKGGGAISVAGTAALSFVTVVSNTSTNKIGAGILRNGGTVAVKNSIVANNVDQTGDFHDCSGSPNFESVLLSSDQGCNPTGDFLVVSEVMFGPLGDYGGATPTLPLQDNPDGTLHPAVGLAGDCADLGGAPVSFDQRGVTRPQGTGCDAGAYERDQTPPVVTATTDPVANSAGWNNTPVEITLTTDEPATIEYSLDGGTTWSEYAGPFTISDEGTTTVSYRATDVDGNQSSTESVDVSIDVTPPTVSATQTAGTSEGDIDVTLTTTDVLSGVESIWYQIDSDFPGTVTSENPVTVTITATGTTTITFSALDVAGNSSGSQTVDVTIDPLTLAVTLDTSVPEIEVGAVTVPLANIPTAIRTAAGPETTTASTPLSAIPLSAIPLSAIELDSTPLSAIPLSAIPLSAIPLSAIGDSTNTLTAVPLSAIPLSAIPLSAIPLSAIPLEGTPLSAIPLSAILLSDIGTDLLSDGDTQDLDLSVEELLAGSDLQDTPTQSLTFEDLVSTPLSAIDLLASPLSAIPLSAIPLSAIGNIVDCTTTDCETATLGDVGSPGGTIGDLLGFDDVNFASTPLSAIPLSAIALGTLPLSAIPLSAIDSSGTTLTGLDAWCELLGAQLCLDLSITSTDNNVSLMTLALAGVPLSAIPLSAIDLTDIPLSAIPLSAIPLSAIDFSATPLSAIPVDSFDPPVCTSGCTGTLGEVTDFGTATVGDLENGIPAGYSLADLLFGIIGAGSIPWQELDLQASRLPDAADPKQPSFDYVIGIDVGGARTADVDITLDLPEGFVPAYDVKPPTLDGTDIDAPVESDGVLTFTGLSLTPGSHTVTVPMRAGIVLGDFTTSVTVDGTAPGSDPASAGPATASITVIEAGEGGPVPVIQDGNLELSHISVSDDIDLYSFSVGEGEAGASADILLSNLPIDLDLVLYGPPLQAPLRGDPTVGYGTIEDFRYDLNPDDDALDPDALEDIPNAAPAGSVRQAVSANRDTTDELIETGTLREGTYYIQVSSYNGGASNEPFALRVRLDGTAVGPCTVNALRSGASPVDAMPAGYPDGLNTLFLYNSAWLADAYGASNQIFMALDQITSPAWSDLGVIAASVPVDADAGIWSALQAWDTDRCNPLAPNDVVREIGDLIDSIRTTHPTLENIVIVGDDSQIPFARLPDGVSVSNETEHGRTIQNDGELKRALSGGYYFSDDPYGSTQGISVADHEFFVPELAVGRLVETPEQIAGLLGDFVTYGGVLDPDTADGSFAAASGYDFLSDGTVEVIDGLTQGGYTVDVENNETWTRQDLVALLSGNALTAVSVNAHFDETRALPSLGNATGDESDLFTTSDLPLTGLTRSMVFSMGCHSGLSASDIQIGLGVADWAQSFAEQGNLYAANSGYGYGDTKVVAYSEQISAYFAEYLPMMSVGEAWVAAKQRFASQLFTLTPYHEKVSQEFIFYGLPMFRALPDTTGPTPGPDPVGSGPAVINDPFGNGEVAPVAITLSEGAASAPGTLNLVETDEGDYYEVDGEKLLVRGRPVQPLTGLDVTRPDGAGGTVAGAAGAFITGLVGRQITGFDPLVFDPIVDLGDAEAPLRDTGTRFSAGETTFPAGLQRVVSYVDETGQERDRVVVVPGRYKSDGSTQELFTSIEALIHYRDPASTDFTAPFIRQSLGRYGAGIAHFEIDVRGDATANVDDVERVYVLFRPKGQTASTTWLGVDLARVPGTSTWLGGRPVLPFTDTDYEFFVQAVDGNGNISAATSKGVNFLTIQPTSDENITITTNAEKFPSGWYAAPIIATATSTGVEITSYVLDGIESTGSGTASQAIPIAGDGGHLLLVFDSAGRQGVFFAAIDETAPEVSASAEPDVEGGWIGGDSTVTIRGFDPFGSGVVRIEYSLDDGVTWTTVEGKVATIPVSETSTILYRAIDGVDRESEQGSITVQIDNTSPTVTAAISPTPNAAGWNNSATTVTITADDLGQSGVSTIEYSLDGGSTWLLFAQAIEPVEGVTTIGYRATDSVGNTSDAGSITARVDLTDPSVSIISPVEAIEYGLGEAVTAQYTCSDEGSGIATCIGSIADGAPIDTSTAGTFTFTVTATDVAGRSTTETVTYSVVDNIDPEITITSPIEGQPYVLGSSLTAGYSCTDDSGVVETCEAEIGGTPIANGATIPTDTVGTFTMTVTAADGAGNTVSSSVTFTVGYGICLLYDPAREQPATGAVAIKLQICDASGTNLSKANITVTAVSLFDSSGTLDLDPQDSGQSNSAPTFEFRYDAKLKGYIYNLNQDPPLSPGSYSLGFTVGTEPTIYEAPFLLK